ncbi:hypothetical protein E5D57_013105 [Metarhizium anisopliae]|nr:hypothetical protein E5D57_013105 [Metarhizium anisopliae]
MPQGTVSELEKFRVPGTEALEARLMKYLEVEKYAWLRKHWIPKLLEIAGNEKPAVGIAWHIGGTLARLGTEASHMKEKPLADATLDKIYANQDLELFGSFFESKEVAEKAWKQLPRWMPGTLRRSTGRESKLLAPVYVEVIFTSRGSNKAGGPGKELKHKESSTFDGSSSCGRPWSGPSTAPWDQPPSLPSLNSTSFGNVHHSEDEGPNTVDGSSSCGPPASGPSTAPYGQPSPFPSINNTSFGIARHSEDEESSTSSRPNPGGPNAVYHWQESGPPGFGQFPFSSGSLPLAYTHPYACGLPSPFAALPSSTSPGVTSYADTEKAKDERSSASNHSERPWANLSVPMDGEPLVDDDGVVFETPGFRNRAAAKGNKCDGEEET